MLGDYPPPIAMQSDNPLYFQDTDCTNSIATSKCSLRSSLTFQAPEQYENSGSSTNGFAICIILLNALVDNPSATNMPLVITGGELPPLSIVGTCFFEIVMVLLTGTGGDMGKRGSPLGGIMVLLDTDRMPTLLRKIHSFFH
jgi:hypothetical protein